jgi:CDP-diacylglycerol--glycerol-3-phosphate 3-phosphatidyltransferase (EC 2.7.8.5)
MTFTGFSLNLRVAVVNGINLNLIMPLNLPNLLTWLRILLIPLMVGVFYLPLGWVSKLDTDLLAAAFFGFAAVTDWLDGWLARRLGQTSAFGAFLDPVADKLMVAAALIVLVDLNRTSPLIALIIIGREITISALREWMAKAGKSASVAVSFVGKLKTAVQMIAIVMLLYARPLAGIDIPLIGALLLWLAAVLTLVSMLYYLKMAMRALQRADP